MKVEVVVAVALLPVLVACGGSNDGGLTGHSGSEMNSGSPDY